MFFCWNLHACPLTVVIGPSVLRQSFKCFLIFRGYGKSFKAFSVGEVIAADSFGYSLHIQDNTFSSIGDCSSVPSRKRPPIFGLTRKTPLSISAPTTPPWRSICLHTAAVIRRSTSRPTQTPKRAAWSLILQRVVSLSVWPPHTARNAGKQRDGMPKRTTPPTGWNNVDFHSCVIYFSQINRMTNRK